MKDNKSAGKKKTVNEYLEDSGRLINHAESISRDNPDKAAELLSEQLNEHIKILKGVNYEG